MSQRDSRLNYTCSAHMYICTNMCFRSVQRNGKKKKYRLISHGTGSVPKSSFCMQSGNLTAHQDSHIADCQVRAPDRVSGASQQIKNSLISQLLHFLNAEGSKGENITMSPAGEIMSVLHVVYNEDRMEHGYCHRIIKIEFVHGINLFCRFPVRWGSNGHL